MQKDHKTPEVRSTDKALHPDRLYELCWVVLSQPQITKSGWGSAGLHKMDFSKPSWKCKSSICIIH